MCSGGDRPGSGDSGSVVIPRELTMAFCSLAWCPRPHLHANALSACRVSRGGCNGAHRAGTGMICVSWWMKAGFWSMLLSPTLYGRITVPWRIYRQLFTALPKHWRLVCSGLRIKRFGSWPVNPNPLPIERLDMNALFLKNYHQIKGIKGFVWAQACFQLLTSFAFMHSNYPGSASTKCLTPQLGWGLAFLATRRPAHYPIPNISQHSEPDNQLFEKQLES